MTFDSGLAFDKFSTEGALTWGLKTLPRATNIILETGSRVADALHIPVLSDITTGILDTTRKMISKLFST